MDGEKMKLELQIFDDKIAISNNPTILLFIEGRQALMSHSIIKGEKFLTIHMQAGFRTPPKKKK